jgi:hypothetical protein
VPQHIVPAVENAAADLAERNRPAIVALSLQRPHRYRKQMGELPLG